MTPAPKKPAPVRMGGDVASMCERTDRLDRIERKVDDMVRMLTPLFANPALRQAIGAAITTQAMRVRK
jgi:hypothetical protein